jgi:uracil-DNA glycosylase
MTHETRETRQETRIVLLGEAYGANEAEAKAPFVGPSGAMLNKLCIEAGIVSEQQGKSLNGALWTKDYPRRDRIFLEAGIRLTNVFNFQPPANRIDALCGRKHDTLPAIRAGKYLRAEFYPELDRLKEELAEWKPNLILGLGATALWFATGVGQITRKRGTITDTAYGKFLATFHPAYILRGAANIRPIVVADFTKAQRESHSAEVSRPDRTIYIPETLDDICEAYHQMERSLLIAIDIETAKGQITCIGFSWEPKSSLVIPIWDTTRQDNSYWSEVNEPLVWEWVRRICGLPVPKVFQNGLYDLHYIWRGYGITVANCLHDTMLLHHALQPEVQKSLGFLGSLYTDEPAWKYMRARTTLKREDE